MEKQIKKVKQQQKFNDEEKIFILNSIIETLKKDPENLDFIDPVDLKAYPDYIQIITKPISLNQIKVITFY